MAYAAASPAEGSPAELRLRGWSWRHAGRASWAVRDVDLHVRPGERVLLLGPSGSGKSTVLHALAGVLGGEDEGDDQGEILLDGAPPRERRGRAGLVLQDPETQAVYARVGDDVAFGPENVGLAPAAIPGRVRAALEAVDLGVPLQRSTLALSGGQKQRLALAGVLALRPGLLLLDEPTANLDPAGADDVCRAVAAALDATGATAVIVEHRVDRWLPLIDRVVVLDRGGQVLADGDPERVFAQNRRALESAGVWLPNAVRPVRSAVPAGGTMLLQARDLAVARPRSAPAVAGIQLDIAAGERTVLHGPNGSGKSTVALTLGGLLAPAAGTLQATSALARGVGARPIAWSSRQLAERIGSVFQDPEHQFLTPTVGQELALGPQALRREPQRISERVDELLHRLRLDHLREAHPFTLSGGEKRRVSVAAVLATDPSVLVLDEPTFGQDAVTWSELVDLLHEAAVKGAAVVAVSHDEHLAGALGAETRTLAQVALR